MRNSVLYYPTIEINDDAWLKSTLLLWDHVYRIVPKGYHPNDSDEVKKAVDAGLIRSINLENDDVRNVTNRFTAFMDSIPFTPAGLEASDTAYVHPEKIDAHLYPLLDSYSRGFSNEGWYRLPSEVARGYMYFLAQVVAERRGLERCTNDVYSFAVAAYFSELANFDELIYDRESQGFYASLIMKDILPCHISQVPMKNVIDVAQRSANEKSHFRKELLKFSNQLYKCESNDHAKLILNDYKNDLIAAKEELKKSQGFMNENAIGALFTMGVPTALTAFGALAVSAPNDPFSLMALSSSLLIGSIASYSNYKTTQSASNNPSGAGYLISLDKTFSERHTYPAFDRYLEEFIND